MPDTPTGSGTRADIEGMGIVHGALRRDLERTRLVLSTEPFPAGRRRLALADHVLWLMQFLHMHHGGEDAGLWPAVRAANPGAGPLLDRMDRDHRLVAPAIGGVEAAARTYGEDAGGRVVLLDALAALTAVLLPHLEREEVEMMPVVADSLTGAQLDAIEHEFFVAPLSISQLADVGNWVLDGLDAAGRKRMLNVVPFVQRYVLLYGFGSRYRRKTRLLWAGGPAATVRSLRLPLAGVSA